MDAFAACYFCGAAVDTSLSERPLISPSLSPTAEAGATLTLCSTCERKLDAVVERVLETVDAADGRARGDAERSTPAGSEERAGGARTQRERDAGRSNATSGGREPDQPDRTAAEPDRSEVPTDPAGQRDEQPTAAASSGATPADSDGPDTRQTVSALENSKVMRMLENRDFPVEREPFEHVVANAYDVRPEDVARVIEMAIDRGLVAERGGDLVRPE